MYTFVYFNNWNMLGQDRFCSFIAWSFWRSYEERRQKQKTSTQWNECISVNETENTTEKDGFQEIFNTYISYEFKQWTIWMYIFYHLFFLSFHSFYRFSIPFVQANTKACRDKTKRTHILYNRFMSFYSVVFGVRQALRASIFFSSSCSSPPPFLSCHASWCVLCILYFMFYAIQMFVYLILSSLVFLIFVLKVFVLSYAHYMFTDLLSVQTLRREQRNIKKRQHHQFSCSTALQR